MLCSSFLKNIKVPSSNGLERSLSRFASSTFGELQVKRETCERMLQKFPTPLYPVRFASSSKQNSNAQITSLDLEADFHKIGDLSLEKLTDLLAPIEDIDEEAELNSAQGVLSLKLKPSNYAATRSTTHDKTTTITWVINKQTPNRQLWWSSPLSGPRRYEWIKSTGSVPVDEWQVLREWQHTRVIAAPGSTPTPSTPPTAAAASTNASTSTGTSTGGSLLTLLQNEVLHVTGIDILSHQ
jgi:frataxin-like iron-binding protein CyaY